MATQPRQKHRERIDFGRIADAADLPSILAAEGVELRNGKTMCPYHDNSQTAALSVYRKGDRWLFKCHGCDAKGDAIDWVVLRDGVSKLDAAKLLDGQLGISTRPRAAVEARPRHQEAPREWTNPAWQEVASLVIDMAQRDLWDGSGRGKPALEWLRWRGLDDHTIGLHRLGYLGGEGYSPKYKKLDGTTGVIRHARGITMPWAIPTGYYGDALPKGADPDAIRWAGVNVRKLMPDPFEPLPEDEEKNECFSKSQRGFGYPFGEILPGQAERPCVVAEGEIDALILAQEIGDLANVMTVGGAKQPPDKIALDAVLKCPWVLFALDADKAGIEGVRMWLPLVGAKGRRLLLGGHKDVGDMHMAGESVRDWFVGELARLGIDPRAREIGWRERVASWPMHAWKAWHERSVKLTPAGATADQVGEAQRSAYEQVARELGATA